MSYNPQNPNGQTTSANSSPVVISSDQSAIPVSGTFYQATQPVSISSPVAVTGTFWQAVQPISGTITANAGTGTFDVSATSLPLPSGAATESTLSTLNNKVPSLGQALAAGSVPVVLTASQLSTLTPLSSVSVSNFPATQTVSGTVTANISGSISNTAFGVNNGSGASAVNIQDGGNSITVDGSVSATQLGAWDVGPIAVTSGGVVPSSGASVGGTTAITLYANPGQVYGWYFYNPNSTAAYIHFYDTSNTITVGTFPIAYYVLVIPPTTGANVFGIGITHTTSIKMGISQGRLSGAAMSSAVDYTIFYK